MSWLWQESFCTSYIEKNKKFTNAEKRNPKMSDLIAQIDVEIESCERAIRNAYSVQEVDALTIRVQELIKQRFMVCIKENRNE